MSPLFASIRFWRSLPAIFACLLMAVFGLLLLRVNPTEIRNSYIRAAGNALYEKNYDTARVAYQRLIAIENGTNLETVLDLAITMQDLGNKNEASGLLAAIAPINKPRYAPAHLYIAKSLLKEDKLIPENASLIERHLRNAITLDPSSQEANELLGRYYYARQDWTLAKKYLKVASALDPSVMFMLVEASKQTNDESGVRIWAERIADHFYNEVEVKNSGQPRDRLSWANALILLERYPEAIDELDEGARISHDPAYRQAIADTCAEWGRNLARKDPGNLVLRIRTIQRGLQANPDNASLLELMFDLSHSAEGTEGIALRDALVKIQAAGGSSAILHFIAGNDELNRGNEDAARQHFELAYSLDPQMPSIANNMAMMLIRGDKPDPSRALAIIQTLLDKSPDNPNLRDTRGQILVKLGRWKDAIIDLEFALPQLESKNATHAALSEAYNAMGMQDLADEHKRLSAPK